MFFFFFFFNDTATTEIYTLSLHDALPILDGRQPTRGGGAANRACPGDVPLSGACTSGPRGRGCPGRRSEEHTSELQSPCISYAVFCLKKKKRRKTNRTKEY